MSREPECQCLFLPFADGEVWAMPHGVLAEILTVTGEGEAPPAVIQWRSRTVPVLDRDPHGTAPWRTGHGGSGLVAVLLGLEGGDCPFFGVALRGGGPSLQAVPEAEMIDCPERVLEDSLAAFCWDDIVYQVPDLSALEAQMARAASAQDQPAPEVP